MQILCSEVRNQKETAILGVQTAFFPSENFEHVFATQIRHLFTEIVSAATICAV